MGVYVNIHRQIWNDDKFPFMSDDCQLVFFHLLTTPLGSQFGLFKAGLGGLSDDKRWPVERYTEAFREGLLEGFWEYDERALVVWIPKFPHYNRPNNPNVLKGWFKQFDELPDCELKGKCYQTLKAIAEGLSEGFMQAFAKAFGKPCYEQYSGSGSDTVAGSESSKKVSGREESKECKVEKEQGGDQDGKPPAHLAKQSNFKKQKKPTKPSADFTSRQLQAWKALREAKFKVPGNGQQTAWENVDDPVQLARDLGGDAYPGVDASLVYRLASWSQGSPKRRKKLGLFLRNRFSASQEKGGTGGRNEPSTPSFTHGGDLEKKVDGIK